MVKTDGKIPVLLDTDIGSDIDDAACLAYLLCQPRCELLGITTVSGRPQKRAALADAVCRAAGRTDIPIHSGLDIGLLGTRFQPECPQAAVLKTFDHHSPEGFTPYSAIDFLRQQINARPGEITLLAIGPMTNLGVLFASDPTVSSKLKRLVLMCGVFTCTVAGHWREWNAMGDPVATAIAYRARAAGHTSIGLDVTTRCQLPCDEAIRRFRSAGGPLSVVADAATVWKKRAPKITFHDPLAAAVIFKPEICKYLDGRVEVELRSERLAGSTFLDTTATEKPHRIAVEVDPEAFLTEYFTTVGSKE